MGSERSKPMPRRQIRLESRLRRTRSDSDPVEATPQK